MNEAETRAEHIDPALKAAGWGVVPGRKILREHLIMLGCIEGHGRLPPRRRRQRNPRVVVVSDGRPGQLLPGRGPALFVFGVAARMFAPVDVRNALRSDRPCGQPDPKEKCWNTFARRTERILARRQ